MSKVQTFREAFDTETYTVLPTPVERLEHVTDAFGRDVWVKRDDQTGTLYAGNKVRKIDYLFGDCKKRGFTKVCTVGAIGSNHCLATAIHAKASGLGYAALHFPQPVTDHVRHNLLAISSLDPDLTLAGFDDGLAKQDFRARLKEWRNARPDYYFIPAGGSSAVGALGYVQAGLELAEQVETPFDTIVVAAGTCGTLAGLTLGLRIAGWPTKILGIRVVERSISNPAAAARLANDAGDMIRDRLGWEIDTFGPDDFHFDETQYGAGYGVPTAAGRDAISLAAKDGLYLEPTYTGKTLAGLLNYQGDGSTLYWHTLSGVDLTAMIEAGDVSRLPDAYAQFLEPS